MWAPPAASSKGRAGTHTEREDKDEREIHFGPSSSRLLGNLALSPPPPLPFPAPSGVLLTPLCQPSEVLSLSGRPSQISSLLKRPGRPG